MEPEEQTTTLLGSLRPRQNSENHRTMLGMLRRSGEAISDGAIAAKKFLLDPKEVTPEEFAFEQYQNMMLGLPYDPNALAEITKAPVREQEFQQDLELQGFKGQQAQDLEMLKHGIDLQDQQAKENEAATMSLYHVGNPKSNVHDLALAGEKSGIGTQEQILYASMPETAKQAMQSSMQITTNSPGGLNQKEIEQLIASAGILALPPIIMGKITEALASSDSKEKDAGIEALKQAYYSKFADREKIEEQLKLKHAGAFARKAPPQQTPSPAPAQTELLPINLKQYQALRNAGFTPEQLSQYFTEAK